VAGGVRGAEIAVRAAGDAVVDAAATEDRRVERAAAAVVVLLGIGKRRAKRSARVRDVTEELLFVASRL
jgi:hypothetical protein